VSWALALTSSFLTFWSVGSAASIIPSINDETLNFHYGLWTFCAGGGAPVVNSGCFGYGGLNEPSTLVAARAFVVIVVVVGIWAALAATFAMYSDPGCGVGMWVAVATNAASGIFAIIAISCYAGFQGDTNSDASWFQVLYLFYIVGPLGYSTSFYFGITYSVLWPVAAILLAVDGCGHGAHSAKGEADASTGRAADV